MRQPASAFLDATVALRRINPREVRPAAATPVAFQPLARILVSDDDADIRKLYAALLPAYGFEYLPTPGGDGLETLELARRVRPDLVITDVNKPGLDGHSLARALRADAATAQIPVLTVTAMDPWSEGRRFRPSVLDDYFAKPFSFETMIYRIVGLLSLDAPAHDRLVERARSIAGGEHFNPVTGFPCFYTLERHLAELTTQPDWVALDVELAAFPALVRTHGRAAAEGFLARLAGAVREAAGAEIFAAHVGYEPRIVLLGTAPAVAAAGKQLVARFASIQRRIAADSPDLPFPRLHLRYADHRDGYTLSLPALRAALRSS